jgi:hypothetical protein
MSPGADKQTGRPDVALSLATPENVSYVVNEDGLFGSQLLKSGVIRSVRFLFRQLISVTQRSACAASQGL